MTAPLITIEKFLDPWLQVAHTIVNGVGGQPEPKLEDPDSAYATYAKRIIDVAMTDHVVEKSTIVEAIDRLLDALTEAYLEDASQIPLGFGAAYLHRDFWQSQTGIVIFRALRRTLGDGFSNIDDAAHHFGVPADRIYYLVRNNKLPVYLDTVGSRSSTMFVRIDQLKIFDLGKEK